MRSIDLFSGIGGFSYAAETVFGKDLEIAGFCEIDKFCQQILNKHWPNVPIFDDIKELDETSISGKIDIITGGFPCQPFSNAGKQLGTEDVRHLWPEMYRVIKCFSPDWVVGENVYGFISWNEGMVFEQSCVDLENEGYEVGAYILPACSVDAPHKRDRVWIIAHKHSERLNKRPRQTVQHEIEESERQKLEYICQTLSRSPDVANSNNAGSRFRMRSEREGQKGTKEWRWLKRAKSSKSCEDVSHSNDQRLQRYGREYQPLQKRETERTIGDNSQEGKSRSTWLPEPNVGRVAHGIPNRVDRIKALGNAIVPQVAMQIFQAIKEYENASN